MAQTLLTYFRAIDSGDYATAWSQFTAQQRQNISLGQFAAGLRTSYDFNISLQSLTPQGPGVATVYATFTSLQSPQFGPRGESCDHWSIDYTMNSESGSWLIQLADAHNGQQPASVLMGRGSTREGSERATRSFYRSVSSWAGLESGRRRDTEAGANRL